MSSNTSMENDIVTAAPPPPGVAPNFVDPDSRAGTVFCAAVIFHTDSTQADRDAHCSHLRLSSVLKGLCEAPLPPVTTFLSQHQPPNPAAPNDSRADLPNVIECVIGGEHRPLEKRQRDAGRVLQGGEGNTEGQKPSEHPGAGRGSGALPKQVRPAGVLDHRSLP